MSDRRSEMLEKEPYCRIMPYLFKGSENGIHLCELSKYSGIEDRYLRKAIEQIRRAGIVILSDAEHGYYLPDNSAELAAYIRKEERRARSTLYTLKSAKTLYQSITGEKYKRKIPK